jgi:excinuclease ABC subunit B
VEGKVIMYADRITGSMSRAIGETERRRALQLEFNQRHGITPMTITKAVRGVIEATKVAEEKAAYLPSAKKGRMTKKELKAAITKLEKGMREAARQLEFEKAAELRDMLIELRLELRGKDSRLLPVGTDIG